MNKKILFSAALATLATNGVMAGGVSWPSRWGLVPAEMLCYEKFDKADFSLQTGIDKCNEDLGFSGTEEAQNAFRCYIVRGNCDSESENVRSLASCYDGISSDEWYAKMDWCIENCKVINAELEC